MSATEMIYKIIDEKCLKQSAVARAAGYDPEKIQCSSSRTEEDDIG